MISNLRKRASLNFWKIFCFSLNCDFSDEPLTVLSSTLNLDLYFGAVARLHTVFTIFYVCLKSHLVQKFLEQNNITQYDYTISIVCLFGPISSTTSTAGNANRPPNSYAHADASLNANIAAIRVFTSKILRCFERFDLLCSATASSSIRAAAAEGEVRACALPRRQLLFAARDPRRKRLPRQNANR